MTKYQYISVVGPGWTRSGLCERIKRQAVNLQCDS